MRNNYKTNSTTFKLSESIQLYESDSTGYSKLGVILFYAFLLFVISAFSL